MKKAQVDSRKFIELLGENAKDFTLSSASNLELSEIKPGVWILTSLESDKKSIPVIEKSVVANSPPAVAPKIGVEEKILSLLEKKPYSDRVEGMFESFLFKDELPVLQKMLADKKIEKFKLSDKYKKPIYRIVELRKDSENPSAIQKNVEDYSLEKDGFLVVKNELRAKSLSQELEKDIKDNKIRGIKSFDGFFYIADNSLVLKYTPRMIEFLKNAKSANSDIISKALNISPTLTHILCEFAKEDGVLIEKRKDLYAYIS